MISVICPVYNEIKYIEKIINFFLESEPSEKELLIIDGGSNDGTYELVSQYSLKYPSIILHKNPDKYVPSALNIGIRHSKGDPIIRIDAHSEYSADYFERILKVFNETGADIVGGPCLIKSQTELQKSIGFAVSSKFGVGNSLVHQANYEGYSDSVTFGAWHRQLFEEVGYFDKELKHDQDDEFHYRAKSKGKKIFQSPSIKLWYYPRSSLSGLTKQYFQYGLYKPLVLQKVKSEIKFRHLIPSLFVVYLISLIIYHTSFLLLPAIVYFLSLLMFSLFNKESIFTKVSLLIIYPVIHISYGTGFILGLKKLIK